MTANKWDINNIEDQAGRIAIVTGSTSGIGLETARVLAHKRATVILAVRNLNKGKAAADVIKNESRNGDVSVMELDLADLASVRRFAAGFRENHSRLDLLINNAGVMVPPYTQTRDGFMEMKGYPRKVKSVPLSHDPDIAERLWKISEALTDVSYPEH